MSIINPLTGRAVKIGSTTHKKLIRQQVLTYSDALNEDEKVLYEFTASELNQPGYINAKKKELEKLLPRTQQAVLGRGRYKSCLVVRDRQLGKEDYQTIHREVSRMRDVEEEDSDEEDVMRSIETQMDKKEKRKQANMPKTKSFRIKQEKKQPDESVWKPPVDSEAEEVDEDDIEEEDEEEY